MLSACQSPGLTLSSSEIVFHVEAGATATVSQTIQLTGGTEGEAWSSSATDAWLSAAPQSGTTPASIVVSVDPAEVRATDSLLSASADDEHFFFSFRLA